MLTLGYADISTEKITRRWRENNNEIRKIMENKEREKWTKEEKGKIEKAVKEDFYVWYQNKKYRRMDLLKKHGVRDIRELEFAEMILKVIEELSEYAQITRPETGVIIAVTDEVIRKERRLYSTYAKTDIAQKSAGILNMYNSIQKIVKKIHSKKMREEEKEALKRAHEKIKEMLTNRIQEQRNLKRIYEKYLEIN